MIRLILVALLVIAVCGCEARLQTRHEVTAVSADAAPAAPVTPEPIPRLTGDYYLDLKHSKGFVYILRDNQNDREFIIVGGRHGATSIVETKPK